MGMMGGAIASAALTATSQFMASEQRRSQSLAQASALDSQAAATYRRANQVREVSELEARRIDRQKIALRRQYENMMGRNRARAAAGFVDPTSGSTAEIAEGNAQLFADDMGENAYAAALKRWEGRENQKALQFQAAQYDAQSSYLEQTSGNLLTSLLSATMAGAGGFFGAGGAQALNSAQAPQTTSTFQSMLNRQINTTQSAGGVPIWRR